MGHSRLFSFDKCFILGGDGHTSLILTLSVGDGHTFNFDIALGGRTYRFDFDVGGRTYKFNFDKNL